MIMQTLHIVNSDGQVVGEVANPAVSTALLLEISLWKRQGVEWSDILSRLRLRTVPPGYTYSPWKPCKCLFKYVVILLSCIKYFPHMPCTCIKTPQFCLAKDCEYVTVLKSD